MYFIEKIQRYSSDAGKPSLCRDITSSNIYCDLCSGTLFVNDRLKSELRTKNVRIAFLLPAIM